MPIYIYVYCNLSLRFLRTYFQQGGLVSPQAPCKIANEENILDFIVGGLFKLPFKQSPESFPPCKHSLGSFHSLVPAHKGLQPRNRNIYSMFDSTMMESLFKFCCVRNNKTVLVLHACMLLYTYRSILLFWSVVFLILSCHGSSYLGSGTPQSRPPFISCVALQVCTLLGILRRISPLSLPANDITCMSSIKVCFSGVKVIEYQTSNLI